MVGNNTLIFIAILAGSAICCPLIAAGIYFGIRHVVKRRKGRRLPLRDRGGDGYPLLSDFLELNRHNPSLAATTSTNKNRQQQQHTTTTPNQPVISSLAYFHELDEKRIAEEEAEEAAAAEAAAALSSRRRQQYQYQNQYDNQHSYQQQQYNNHHYQQPQQYGGGGDNNRSSSTGSGSGGGGGGNRGGGGKSLPPPTHDPHKIVTPAAKEAFRAFYAEHDPAKLQNDQYLHGLLRVAASLGPRYLEAVIPVLKKKYGAAPAL